MTNACHIIVEHLGVTFDGGSQVLDDVSFSSLPGRFVAVVGPSGCGKSTLLRCLAALQRPTTGRLDLRLPSGEVPRRAFVFQDANLLPWRDVRDNVALPLELAGRPRSTTQAAVDAATRIAGLKTADVSKRPHMLSGGMRMRTSLARALILEPELMLLDEPFAALDDISRQELNDELMQIWLAQHWSSVLVTHHVGEAVFLSERVLVMSHCPGRIVADVSIPFTYPRSTELRMTAEFAQITGLIADHLRSTLESA